MLIVKVTRRLFSDFVERNQQFMKKINKYNRGINQHQKVSDISQ